METAISQRADKTEQQAAEKLFKGKTTAKLFSGISIDHGRVPVDLCDRGRYQPRQDFDPQQLQELADSLRQTGGNIQPVILRPKANGRYEILAGERRVRATLLAGIDSVLAITGAFDDDQCHVITVVENLQRSDLNPIEEAQGFQSLLDKGLKQQVVAASVGKSRVFIANAVRLLKLDIGVRDLLRSGKLSQGHGKAIAGLNEHSVTTERELARKCVRMNWSVRRLEAEVQSLNTNKEASIPRTKDANLRRLEELATGKFGAPIAIRPSSKIAGGGFIHIPFTSESEMRTILEKMNAWPDDSERD
ncbi:ParB/RepB/Spo0J family partition protein [Parendozoicomonas sp. Alg238-R29]|uniref:ParB/RepB/Spo0J family partition protein n=1 Tax=Parendozoicomonas sp. Alg238-R29 TaxID=2993446 RepID=UPI00248E93D1|nr:ParB/RepB/Spo0J family partition protein [Parendozoicomonas sp. Alg238-R29]